MTLRTLFAITLALASAYIMPAGAGSISVSPLRLTFAKGIEIGSITVENNGTDEVLVQAEVFSWSQAAGESKLTATEDLVAVPPVFRMPPSTQKQIRVGLTRAFSDRQEVTYRLMVSEVPTKAAPGSVAVAVRHSLPIFVHPANAASTLAPLLTVKRSAAEGLDLANTGTQHLRIHHWRLRDRAGKLMAEGDGPGYILAGANQTLKIDNRLLASPVTFEADSDARPLKIAVDP